MIFSLWLLIALCELQRFCTSLYRFWEGEMTSFTLMMSSLPGIRESFDLPPFLPPWLEYFPPFLLTHPMTTISAHILLCDIHPLFTKLCPYSFQMLILIIRFYLLFPLFYSSYCPIGLFCTQVRVLLSCSRVLLEFNVQW